MSGIEAESADETLVKRLIGDQMSLQIILNGRIVGGSSVSMQSVPSAGTIPQMVPSFLRVERVNY